MYVVKLEYMDKDYGMVGLKGYSLGRLARENLPVPPGFVITVDAMDNFLKSGKIRPKIANLLENVDYSDPNSVRSASEGITTLIAEAQIPDYIENPVKQHYDDLSVGREVREIGGLALDLIKAGRGQTSVAVRPSPLTADYMPGHLRSVFNVRGPTDVLQAVKTCWASLFSYRSLLFRKSAEVPVMAVIVQKMVDAEKSGLVFTSQVERNDSGKMVVESTWGLGQSLIEGVSPDEFVVDKLNGSVVERRVRKKAWLYTKDQLSGRTIRDSVSHDRIDYQTLADFQVNRIWSVCRRIEELFSNQPQAVEWAEERNRLFILGTRRIDASKWQMQVEEEPVKGAVGSGTGTSPGRVKGRARIIINPEDVEKIEEGDIAVVRSADPSMMNPLGRAAAMVTEEPGRSTHTVSMANELGIPCLSGVNNATRVLRDGQEIIVDALKGKVFEPLVSSAMPVQETPQYAYQTPQLPQVDPEIRDEVTATNVRAILSFAGGASAISEKVDGVLLKVEYMLTEGGVHPENTAKSNPLQLIGNIVRGVEKVAKGFYPKPVWYRSLDATSDIFKRLGGYSEPDEHNPMIGWHGIRRSLDRPDVFRCEIEALRRLHLDGLNNVALVLPFVSRLDEFMKVKQMIDFPMKLGIIVETPAVALGIEEFCKAGADFVAIDSGMLSQLALGIDRNNMQTYKLYSEMDPSVIGLIKHVVRMCRKNNVETSVYGEAANNPEVVESLIRLGVNSISTEADTIDHVKTIIARTERKLLLDKLRKQPEE